MEPELILQYAVKVFNDSIDSNILVPSLFVLGSVPLFLVSSTAMLDRCKRHQMIRYAREKAAQIRAEQRLITVLEAIALPSAKYKIEPGN